MPKIVSVNDEGFRRDTRFPRTWLLLALLVVLIVSVGVYWWATHKTAPATVQKTPETPSTTKGITLKSPDEYRSDITKATKTEDKIALTHSLITAQQLDGDITGAIKSTQELLNIEKIASNYALLGALYKANGQKAEAIDAYEKALSLVPATSDPDLVTDYNIYKEALASLRGGS